MTKCNKSLKPTALRVARTLQSSYQKPGLNSNAKCAPRYGSLIPPLGPTLRAALTAGGCTHPLVSLRERSLTIDFYE